MGNYKKPKNPLSKAIKLQNEIVNARRLLNQTSREIANLQRIINTGNNNYEPYSLVRLTLTRHMNFLTQTRNSLQNRIANLVHRRNQALPR